MKCHAEEKATDEPCDDGSVQQRRRSCGSQIEQLLNEPACF